MRPDSIEQRTNTRNLKLLVSLRWLAVAGQIVTIAVAQQWLHLNLPLAQMGTVILFLIGLNLASLYLSRSNVPLRDAELFVALLLDVIALTVQLYLSGGATNPFIALFLLQIILGAVLLRPRWTWTLFGVTSMCFLGLMHYYRDVGLEHYAASGIFSFVDLRVEGSFVSFVLASVLLIFFLSRINRNLRERDRRLSDLRQQRAEEEHIVRMGLLASGAAHELGTPLATLSVIVNEWRRIPELAGNSEIAADIRDMQQALGRCKQIVSRVLLTAGQARGEEAERTTLIGFFDRVVADWRAGRSPNHLEYTNYILDDAVIVSETVLIQALFNAFDNALEASPDWVSITIARDQEWVVIEVRDRGPGFAPHILANFGKPYQSTKGRDGRGLGLFLIVNVMRKLGGYVTPSNRPEGGATVTMRLPLEALSLEDRRHDL
ncbi:MAG: HAMP domain-containing histidine kinase [Alphaproteobacteria bacterium]|nr:HAMP domain-containing histidine kinase [Alphaproteobacteria bacterium]